jgi:hypothetical protein
MPRGLIVISRIKNGATDHGTTDHGATEDDDKFPRPGEERLSLGLHNEGNSAYIL